LLVSLLLEVLLLHLVAMAVGAAAPGVGAEQGVGVLHVDPDGSLILALGPQDAYDAANSLYVLTGAVDGNCALVLQDHCVGACRVTLLGTGRGVLHPVREGDLPIAREGSGAG
jgi:hypothetical protein